MSATKEEAIVPTRSDWLEGQPDDPILLPDLPIVDSHHHLWSHGGDAYLLPQFLADVDAGHRIVASVYMQCHAHDSPDGPEHLRPVGEVEFVAGVAEQAERQGATTRVCEGIVGYADLRLGDRVQEVLDALGEAGRGRFRGVRQIVAWHPDPEIKCTTVFKPPPGMLLDPNLRRGLKVLARNGKSFDTWAVHTQMIELFDLACSCPDLTVVTDHTGGTIAMGLYDGRRDVAFEEWRTAIRILAQAPNAHAKIGGFGMRISGFRFHERPQPPTSEELAAAIRPYVETCIDAFGPSRCMFESNFPVDKGSFGYQVLWNAYKRIARDYSEDERNMLFHGTAERVYRLNYIAS